MNIRKRERLNAAATVRPGDTLTVTWREAGEPDRVLVRDTFDKTMTFTEAITFEDVIEGRRALGAALLEEERA